jgi:hypothetical protein
VGRVVVSGEPFPKGILGSSWLGQCSGWWSGHTVAIDVRGKGLGYLADRARKFRALFHATASLAVTATPVFRGVLNFSHWQEMSSEAVVGHSPGLPITRD